MRDVEFQLTSILGLKDTAPVIRATLDRLNGRAVLIATSDGVPVTNGTLVMVEGMDGPVLPSLMLEFTLRGIVFAMEIPLDRVFAIVKTWTGTHFVFRLPEGRRLTLEWPRENGTARAAAPTSAKPANRNA